MEGRCVNRVTYGVCAIILCAVCRETPYRGNLHVWDETCEMRLFWFWKRISGSHAPFWNVFFRASERFIFCFNTFRELFWKLRVLRCIVLSFTGFLWNLVVCSQSREITAGAKGKVKLEWKAVGGGGRGETPEGTFQKIMCSNKLHWELTGERLEKVLFPVFAPVHNETFQNKPN